MSLSERVKKSKITDYEHTSDPNAIVKKELVQEILALETRLDKAIAVVEDLRGLISESDGVYGLHKNGENAPWHTLMMGGEFGAWLYSLSEVDRDE
jgi:hypothetical protein